MVTMRTTVPPCWSQDSSLITITVILKFVILRQVNLIAHVLSIISVASNSSNFFFGSLKSFIVDLKEFISSFVAPTMTPGIRCTKQTPANNNNEGFLKRCERIYLWGGYGQE